MNTRLFPVHPTAPTPAAPEPTPAGPDVDFNLVEYLAKIRRHWKVVVALSLICLTVAIVRYSMTPKRYQAAARVQIERRSTNPLIGNVSPWLENWWNMEYYPTQYKLLESFKMAREAARLMALDGPPEEAARASLDEGAIDQHAAQLRGGLQVLPIRGTQLVDLVFRAGSAQEAAEAANAYADAFVQFNYQARSSTASTAGQFLDEQIETLKLEINEKQQALQEKSRETDIVAVDPDANVTLQRLDTLNSQYMMAKQQRIESKSRYDALSSISAEAVASNEAEGLIGQLRSEILRKESEYNAKLRTFKEDWPEMVELKGSIEKTKEEMQKLVNETARTERQEAYSTYQAALRQEQTLEQEMKAITSTAIDEQLSSVEIGSIRGEVEARQELLNQLMRRRSETVLTSNLQGFAKDEQNNVRVIDYATVPGAPYFPSLQRSLMMGLLAGLALSLGAVVLLEYLDRTVKGEEEAERLLGLPVLAVIPDLDASNKGGYGYGYGYGRDGGEHGRDQEGEAPRIELLPHARPRLPVSEAYRALRTALLLSTANGLQVVTVTSAQTGEGKTATATNLAVVMAQLGQRVLLLDADLRKPRLHQVFGISNRFGLVNLLTGGEKIETVLRQREVAHATEVPNLFVLPSGPIPPNPAELLASRKMRDFLNFLRQEDSGFDFVVVDTTPTLAVTDATIVASMVDGVLLCLRANKVRREDAVDCRDRLMLSEVKILGTVLNRYSVGRGRYAERYRHYEVYGAEPVDLRDEAEGSAA